MVASKAKTMQAYQVHLVDNTKTRSFPSLLQNLGITSVSVPTAGPGSVVVQVRAVSLNPRDLAVISGTYPFPTTDGVIPCLDAAGEIYETGPNSKWSGKVGTKVIVNLSRDWLDGDAVAYVVEDILGSGSNNGTLAQYIVLEDNHLSVAPSNLSFIEAATLGCTGTTAIHVLSHVPTKHAATIVTQGTGGVSCSVIQFAAARGYRVIATSSSDEKLQKAKQLGATDFINYRSNPDWAAEVLKLTNNKGADLVADVVGGASLEQSIRALRQGGTVCVIGLLSGSKPVDVTLPLLIGLKTLKGILGASVAMAHQTVQLVEEHDIHPLIGKVFEWEDAPLAFEALNSQKHVGKIVVKV